MASASEDAMTSHSGATTETTTVAHEHRTVTRVTSILELVAAAAPDSVRLGDLAAALDAPKSSVHGFAQGLVAVGYLIEDGSSYRMGPAAAALLTPPELSLADATRPFMKALRDQFDESVMLAELIGTSYVFVASVESTQLIRYIPAPGRRPLYPSSPGKVLLAAMPVRRQRGYLQARLENADAVNAAEEDLRAVRQQGVGFNRGETVSDVIGVAAPIVRDGMVTAALCLAGPDTRMLAKVTDVSAAVRAAAAEISATLR
jgi:DNA-binding IclR family transcriptional regulator